MCTPKHVCNFLLFAENLSLGVKVFFVLSCCGRHLRLSFSLEDFPIFSRKSGSHFFAARFSFFKYLRAPLCVLAQNENKSGEDGSRSPKGDGHKDKDLDAQAAEPEVVDMTFSGIVHDVASRVSDRDIYLCV